MKEAFRQIGFFESVEDLPFSAFIFEKQESGWHWHDYFEFLYGLEGEYEVLTDHQRFRCHRGDFLMINASEPHATIRGLKNSRLLVIQFDLSVLYPPLAPVYEAKSAAALLQAGITLQRHTHLDDDDPVHQILDAIHREYTKREPGYELAVKADIMRLFVCLLRKKLIVTDSEAHRRKKEMARLMPVLRYVEEHYAEKIDQKAAAGLIYVSVPWFCRQFQQTTGMCFTDYVQKVRVYEAEKLLLSTDWKVTRISDACGFGNVTYFNRIFKKISGLTPRQYREENQISF